MTDLVEFYVACNPPLLPQGVSEVIRRVQGAEGLLEILFEPHAPWFKCIAAPTKKQQICAAIEKNLFAIGDEDVDTLDMVETTVADISIISPYPRMIPWSEFTAVKSQPIKFADADVFPETIAESRYKTLWTGLEKYSTVGFPDLLCRCNNLLGPYATPGDQDEFEKLMKCKISYNLRQSLVYIGSDESQEAIEQTVQKLDTLVHICNNMNRVQHQLVLDSEDGQYLAYKWLSHLGFHRTTYLPYQPGITSSDCRMLMNAATIRTTRMNAHGYWIPERQPTTSSTPNTPSTDSDTLKLRNYDYKTILVKRLRISDDLTFPDEQAGAIENWRDLVRKLSASPEEKILPPQLESSHSGDTINDDDLFSSLNSNDTGDFSGRSSRGPAHMIDLLDDIPVNIKSTLQTIIVSTEEKSQDIFNFDEDEDLISFEEITTETIAVVTSPDLDANDLASIPSFDQDLEQNSTSEAVDEAVIDIKTRLVVIDKPRNPDQQNSSKMELKREVSSATSIINDIAYLQTTIHALNLMPGRVSVRLDFGRIFLRGVPESYIDIQQTLKYDVNEVSKQIKDFDGKYTEFSPILSAKEDTIPKLARLAPNGTAGWNLFETRVYYDLHCSFGPAANGHSVVEIDPERGTTCRSGFAECFVLYLHFPKDQWDLKLAGRQHYDLTGIEKTWIEGWLESSKVSKLAKGGLKFEFLDRPGPLATVKGIVIRHVLLYKQAESDTDLTITFSRKLNLVAVGGQTAGSMVPVTWQTPKNRPPGKAMPDEWVEASLRSRVVDDLLDAEASPAVVSKPGDGEPGDDTPKYERQLAGLTKMASCGGDMIKQMYGIGRDNDNGQSLDRKNVVTQPWSPPGGQDKGDRVEYW